MSSGSNIYKPKLTGLLIAAVALLLVVVVILISTVLILSAGADGDNTTDGQPSETPLVNDPEVTPGTSAPNETPGETTGPTDPVTGPTTEPGTVEPGAATVTVDKALVGQGPLVLIDATHLYTREGLVRRGEMTLLIAERLGFGPITGGSGNYSVTQSNMVLDLDARDAFNRMMKDLTAATGSAEVQVRNAYYYDPTITSADTLSALESVEHSTGCVVDLQVYKEGGAIYPLNFPSIKGLYYNWLTEHCWEYGFIHLRDTASYSSFRYVGDAHAAAMKKYNLDLATYLLSLADYTFETRLKVTDGAGREWWIYYVPAESDTVEIPVLGDENAYEISGDNTNGFVVAINSAVFAR